MPAPAICWPKSMTCTRCSRAIAWHCAGVCGSICRPRWRAPRSCRRCRISWRLTRSWSLELSSSADRQVDLVQEGFDCVLRLGPIRDETLIARSAWPVAHGQRRQSRLSGASWRPSIDGRPPAWGTSRNSVFDDAGRKTLWLGNIRTATATRRFSYEVRYTSTARRPTKPAALAGLGLDPGAAVGDWPIPGGSGTLVEIIPDFRRRPLPVSLVVAHRSNLSRRVRAFMKWIEDVLGPYLE